MYINKQREDGLLIMKRILAGFMSVLLAAALVACTAPAADPVPAAQTQQPAAQAAQAAQDATAVEDERVSIHIFGSRSPVSPEDWNTKQLVQEWSEAVNVHFEWELVTTGFQDAKSLRLASGDWPDVFMTVTDDEIIRYGTEGVFIPLNDLKERYAPNLMSLYTQYPDTRAFMTAPDGNKYTFPFHSIGPWGGINRLMVINTTWLSNLGLDMPTNLHEFRDVLRAFRDGDVNQDGYQTEVIPLSWAGALNGFHPMGWAFAPDFISASFQSPLPSGNVHVQIADGQVYFIPVTEEYRNWIRFMGELFAEGLLDPVGFTQGTDTYSAKLNTDPFSVGVAAVWDIGDSFHDPDAVYHYDFLPPLYGLNGERPVVQFNLGHGGRQMWAITRNAANPEAIVRAVDWIFHCPSISVQHLEGPFHDRLLPCACGLDTAWGTGTPPEGMDNTTWRNTVSLFGATPAWLNVEMYGRYLHLHFTDRKVEFMNTTMAPYKDPEPMPPFFLTLEETQIRAEVLTDINEFVNRMGAEMVINNNVDEIWDRYVEDLGRMGYQRIVDVQQAAVDRTLARR